VRQPSHARAKHWCWCRSVPEESQSVAHTKTRLYILRRLKLERWIRIPYGTGPGRVYPELMRSKSQKLRAHLVKLEDMKTHLLNITKSMEHLQELRYARLIPYLSTPLNLLQIFRCVISEFSCPSGYTDVPLNALLASKTLQTLHLKRPYHGGQYNDNYTPFLKLVPTICNMHNLNVLELISLDGPHQWLDELWLSRMTPSSRLRRIVSPCRCWSTSHCIPG